MLSAAGKHTASETASTNSNDKAKDLPAELQRRVSVLICCLFLGTSELPVRVIETQCLKEAECIIFPTSFIEFQWQVQDGELRMASDRTTNSTSKIQRSQHQYFSNS